MEGSQSLLLNEEAFKICPDPKKPLFIYEWLRFLDKVLSAANKNDLKSCQKELISQLIIRINSGPGPSTRHLLSKCIGKIYTIGDSIDLFNTIATCNDILKGKEESSQQLSIKLTALSVLSALYESVGRLVGRSFEETFTIISKWIKSAESMVRAEILNTITKIILGLGNASTSIHRDTYKSLVKPYLTDRVLSVRIAAINCLHALVKEYPTLYTMDIDGVATLLIKSLDVSNYHTRLAVADVFATLTKLAIKNTQINNSQGQNNGNGKYWTIESSFNLLSDVFIRGGIGGFLKSTVSITNMSSYSSSKEIRNGITLAYIKIIKTMGGRWLEKNQSFVITHLLSVASKIGPIASSDNPNQIQEALHMRRCISFIFRKTFGQIISEHTQISVCKIFGTLLGEFISSYEVLSETNTETLPSVKHISSSQICTVILLEISALVQQIGSSVANLFTDATGIMEPVFASFLHPIQSTRVAAGWALRCIAFAVPSLLTPLIDRCISRLEHMKTFSVAIDGYSCALASLLTASKLSPLGIPFSKSRQVFQLAEDLLRSASSTSNITQQKVKAAWLLLTSLIFSDPLFIRPYISKLKIFWKNSFPKDKEEAEAENQRGDVKTWIFTLTSRSGALASLNAFYVNCKEDMNESIEKKIYNALESSLMTLAQVASLLKSHGTALRSYIFELKIRLYELLINMETGKYNTLNPTLLRELVADISLSDNSSSTTITSLSLSACSLMESNFLGGWLKTTDESTIEMELHPNRSHLQIIDSLESDIFESLTCNTLSQGYWPELISPPVKALDLSIIVFSRLYPTLASKHKIQLTEHFKEVIKSWQRSPARQYSIQLNVLTALLLSIKCLSECRNGKMDNDNLRKTNFELVSNYINHEKIPLRCLAIEFLSRMAQVTKDAPYVAGIAQYCFDKLHTLKDEKSRASFAITIGVLHNYVGLLGSSQHLNTSVSITLALAQDPSSPTVQSWAIFSLSLIANTGSGMFKGYVEPCLSLCLRLLLNVSSHHIDIIRSLGKLTSILITAVGPELQSAVGSVENIRSSFLVACSMMFENNDSFVKAEAIACLQQLHIFAPRFVELDWLVKEICRLMYSPHLVLRKSSIACLKQLLQRESIEVKEHASSLVPQSMIERHGSKNECILPETGLEGGLFELLDIETDPEIVCNIKESIIFLVQATGGEHLNFWMLMVKDILATSTNEMASLNGEKDDNDKNQDEDDDSTFNVSSKRSEPGKEKLLPRWPARVFALEVVQKLLQLCETERAHLDLALAKELQLSSSGKADYLVLHLSDLIRMAFMGATSNNTHLRLAGLATLQDIIKRFAHVSETEFPGHVILEQFQAQVGAALRPAFEQDTPSHITAAACEVCSTWIGSGVVRDINDLKRVHHLLVSSLTKLKSTSNNITPLYNESTATLEKLAILKAWSEVYIVAIEKNNDENSLLHLVDPELNFLVIYWMAALRDSALLSLPPEYSNQLPDDGGSFYIAECVDSCKDYYRDVWPTILLASSIWLSKTNFELTTELPTCRNWKNLSKEARFDIMIGMCLEALCCIRNVNDIDNRVKLCLKSIHFMMKSEWFQEKLMSDMEKCIEIVNALHRIILTRDNLSTQKLCAEVAGDIIKIVIKIKQTNKFNDTLYIGMEGSDGCFDTKRSLAFALLEFCLCLLVRQIPQINTALMNSKTMTPLHFRKYTKLPYEGHELIKIALQLLSQIPNLCHYRGTIVILPSILYMILGVIRESARKDSEQIIGDIPLGHVSIVSATAIQSLRILLSNPLRDEDNIIIDDNGNKIYNSNEDEIFQEWCTEVRSAMFSLSLMDSNPNIPVDQSIILLSLTVMITSVPSDFILGSQLFGKICRIFKTVITSENTKVKLTALQGIISIFSKKDISKSYIKILGPLVTLELKKILEKGNALEVLPEDVYEMDEGDYLILPELCKILTTILYNISSDEKQFQLTALLIQVLVSFVIPSPETKFKNVSKNGKQLNDFCLNQLTNLARNYTENFKKCISAIPILKTRIEDGLKHQGLRSSQQIQMAQMMHGSRKSQTKPSNLGTPTIKLATDFNTKFE
ncbi:Armadillo-like helical domain and Armadillo-type fold domain-containing protein [Strongyloides ratti]|uniref:Armadillo-like helical domain and Armadillo-type fold domain-containing protein n=1 Tax=Strongyloides ratti TaxID=34506 RepID=A0A090KX11_STRRB|nr:Armadillo-like helical domain and Armadillo-type fold domain-containing protein [Strongyloides ratti]CEF62045.1 Armadillo-like helical domain and Armadillo-type fold domain-containing protein [Strongyloides ratti]